MARRKAAVTLAGLRQAARLATGAVLDLPDVRRNILATDDSIISPLLPPRAGHLALLLAAGALTGLCVADDRGHAYLIRGTTVCRPHQSEGEGYIRTDERFSLSVQALDLTSGEELDLSGGPSGSSLADFIERTRDSLARAAAGALRPILQELPPAPAGGERLLRPPLGMQGPAIVALTYALRRLGRVMLVGEQGCGKTYMALAGAYLADSLPALVLCPPHLVEKWAREARLTIPGVAAIVCHRPSDLERARQLAASRPVVAIVGREAAKLGYVTEVAAARGLFTVTNPDTNRIVLFTRAKPWLPSCPRCGRSVSDLPRHQRPQCPWCHEILDACQAGKGPRRYPLARYVARRMKGVFRCLIIDEAHEYRSQDSLQAQAAFTLAGSIPRIIALTGTLLGGYAHHLYNLLFLLSPSFRREFPLQWNGREKFADRYGATSVVQRFDEHRRRRIYRHPAPGVSPRVMPWLLERGIFLRLEEVVRLPPLEEQPLLVEPSPAMKPFLDRLHQQTREVLQQKPSPAAVTALMHALLSYPDLGFAGEEVMDPRSGRLLVRIAPLPPGILPKEEALLGLVRRELEEGRPCLIYVAYTGYRDVTARLHDLLQTNGVRTAVLRAGDVPPARREAWLRRQMAAGIQALICQPRLVALGLDLIHFPTVVWFQPDPDTFTVRQATRRSYRIGQPRPVRVFHMAYAGSAQEMLLALLARKAAASLILEGDAVGQGILPLSEEDTLAELAKAVARGGAEDARAALLKAAELARWAQTRLGWEGPPPAQAAAATGVQLALPGIS